MASNWWESTMPQAMDSAPAMPFPSNISSFFRKPARIVKPVSRNQSPRNLSRRRMTSHVPSRTRSVVDSHRSSNTSIPHWTVRNAQQARPLSWHPNSIDDFNHVHFAEQGMVNGFFSTPFTTTNVNGLATPISYPVVDDPQIQGLTTPLEELSAQEHYAYSQNLNMNQYWQSQQPKVGSHHFAPMAYPDMYPEQWWSSHQHPVTTVSTAPTSPDFLPMPDMGGPLMIPDVGLAPEKEELVGMGLYDSPAEVQSSSLLFGGGQPGVIRRKSLKLEESFEPAPPSSEEDEEESDQSETDNTEGDAVEAFPILEDQYQPPAALADFSPYSHKGFDEPEFFPYMVPQGYANAQWHNPSYLGSGWL